MTAIEGEIITSGHTNVDTRRKVAAIAHGYQPPREYLLFDQKGKSTGNRANVAAFVNEDRIYPECYVPTLVEAPTALKDHEPFQDGFMTSIFGTLREWWKVRHPDTFARMVANLHKRANKDYRVFGDPYWHPIMPRQDAKNQRMLFQLGRQAFQEDMGFEPQSIWLPETAVDTKTLKTAREVGYKAVALRDYQLEERYANPMYIQFKDGNDVVDQMAVIHGDSNLSGEVSFKDEVTADARSFLHNPKYAYLDTLAWMSDLEFYGHHQPFKDHFLYTALSEPYLKEAGLVPFDLKAALEAPSQSITQVREKTSWSCIHSLKRWTGDPECNCDEVNDPGDLAYKRHLYETLTKQGKTIDSSLEKMHGPFWRDKFIDFFLATRKSFFIEGDIYDDIDRLANDSSFTFLRNDPASRDLFIANMCRWTGETSCTWFFGGSDRVERQFAAQNINSVNNLLLAHAIPLAA